MWSLVQVTVYYQRTSQTQLRERQMTTSMVMFTTMTIYLTHLIGQIIHRQDSPANMDFNHIHRSTQFHQLLPQMIGNIP